MKRICDDYKVVSSIGKHNVIIVPVADIIDEDKFKRHDNQRDHEYRVKVQKKIHLTNKERTWFDHEIFAGYKANGKFYLLDGHSRRYAWKHGLAKAPEFVYFHYYDLGWVTEEQRQDFAIEHYGHFNSKEAGKNTGDDKAEIYQQAGFDLDSMNDLIRVKLGIAGLRVAARRMGESLKIEKDKIQERKNVADFVRKHKTGIMVLNDGNAKAGRVGILNGGYAAGLLFCLEWLNDNDQEGFKVLAKLVQDFLRGKHNKIINTMVDVFVERKANALGSGETVNLICFNQLIQLFYNHGLIPHDCYEKGYKEFIKKTAKDK